MRPRLAPMARRMARLALAGGAAREQQARDVRASDQQHRGGQRTRARAAAARSGFASRNGRAPPGSSVNVCRRKPLARFGKLAEVALLSSSSCRCRYSTFIAASACASVTPGFRRANRIEPRRPLVVEPRVVSARSSACIVIGHEDPRRRADVRCLRSPAAATPTTVNGVPFSRIGSPTMLRRGPGIATARSRTAARRPGGRSDRRSSSGCQQPSEMRPDAEDVEVVARHHRDRHRVAALRSSSRLTVRSAGRSTPEKTVF